MYLKVFLWRLRAVGLFVLVVNGIGLAFVLVGYVVPEFSIYRWWAAPMLISSMAFCWFLRAATSAWMRDHGYLPLRPREARGHLPI